MQMWTVIKKKPPGYGLPHSFPQSCFQQLPVGGDKGHLEGGGGQGWGHTSELQSTLLWGEGKGYLPPPPLISPRFISCLHLASRPENQWPLFRIQVSLISVFWGHTWQFPRVVHQQRCNWSLLHTKPMHRSCLFTKGSS